MAGQDNRDIWQKALDVGVPAAVGGAAVYAGGRILKRMNKGKGKGKARLSTKVVQIKPVRKLLPTRTLEGWEREIKYYRDQNGRRYSPVRYNESTGLWETTQGLYRTQHMKRDDGVIFKLRKDGSYVMTLLKKVPVKRKRARRRT